MHMTELGDTPHNRSALSLRQIEVFRAIMRTGSVSEAARSLLVAQPSVTRILQLSEERLGFLLFDRTRGRLTPTSEAKAIYQEVESVYAGVQRVGEIARALGEGRIGNLNVVCSPSLAVHFLPRAIARFSRQFPQLPIRFEALTHNNLVPRVLLGQNYLGVSLYDVDHPQLTCEPLGAVPLVCVAPGGRLDGKTTVAMTELLVGPWIDYDHDTPLGRIVGQAFGDIRRPVPSVVVRSAIAACQLASEGVGVALVDPFCVTQDNRKELEIKQLLEPPMLKLQAVFSHVEPLSHVARAFLDIMKALFDEQRSQLT